MKAVSAKLIVTLLRYLRVMQCRYKLIDLTSCCLRLSRTILSRFADNVLLGGGGRVRVRIQRKFKGTTKPLVANLDITRKQVLYTFSASAVCTTCMSPIVFLEVEKAGFGTLLPMMLRLGI